MPVSAAANNPNFYGHVYENAAMMPAETAAATLARSFKFGTTSAMKVSASVKSRLQLAGISWPTKMPTAVLSCHDDHNVMPAPK